MPPLILGRVNLAIATARIYNKIRSNGLSSREVFTHRDQFSHQQIPLEDKQVIFEKHTSALKNHQYSEQNKSRGNLIRQAPGISIGDLVHLCNDKSKHHPRDRYIVTNTSGHWCQVRKFVGSQLRSNAYKIPMIKCIVCHLQTRYSLALQRQRRMNGNVKSICVVIKSPFI